MKVLMATDGSSCSEAALDRLVDLLPLDKAEVTVISVAPFPVATDVPSMVGAPYVDYTLLADEVKAEAEGHLGHAKEKLEQHGVHPRTVLAQGDAAAQILDLARAEHPDLIVVGSHGRTGFRKLLLGSVSQRIVSDAPCPVLVVKGSANGKGEK